MASTVSLRRRRRRRRPPQATVVAPAPADTGRRVVVVWSLLVLLMALLLGRLVWLQLVQGESLLTMAEQQRLSFPVQRQARRTVVDRQGNVVAVDRVVYTLYAHPRLFNQSLAQVSADLAPLLNRPQADLLSQLSRQPTGIRVVDGLPEEIADRIRALRFDGIELYPQQQRFYPQQDLFAPIVGFVNVDGDPQAGIEMAYHDQLTLTPAEVIAADAADAADLPSGAEIYGPFPEDLGAAQSAPVYGPEFPMAVEESPEPSVADPPPWQQQENLTLQLTLDSRLQRTAQQELQAVIDTHGAKGGTVMVIDAHNGEMLALASLPTYDANQYFKAEPSHLRTWAISDLYEPGSTFKPINIAIALEAGLIGPDEIVNDSGQMQFGEWTIRNHDFATTGGRGPISVTDILKYSSNVGMVRIMQKMPAADYFSWLQRLSLDRPTGIDLPAEAAGQMKDRDQFVRSRVEPATTSFGQGFSMTPIKMLQLQATLANGGKLITPHVVKGLSAPDGQTVWTPDLPEPEKIFSPRATQQVLTMLEAVVDSGTGGTARLPGYRIGGKTGTAQKAAVGGYGRGRITSFAAILPIDNPRYVVLAVIDEPKGDNAYGSTVAAPLVRKVTEALVVLEGLPPSATPSP